MSVYIKGMEMPKNCDNCWALDDYGDYPRCRITEEQRGYNFPIREKRMDNCPLVEIPPHGRLIDADANIKILKKCAADPENDMARVCYNYAAALLDACPTIIPAEEGE